MDGVVRVRPARVDASRGLLLEPGPASVRYAAQKRAVGPAQKLDCQAVSSNKLPPRRQRIQEDVHPAVQGIPERRRGPPVGVAVPSYVGRRAVHASSHILLRGGPGEGSRWRRRRWRGRRVTLGRLQQFLVWYRCWRRWRATLGRPHQLLRGTRVFLKQVGELHEGLRLRFGRRVACAGDGPQCEDGAKPQHRCLARRDGCPFNECCRFNASLLAVARPCLS